MKKVKIIKIFSVLLILIFTLSSCGDSLIKLSYDDGLLVNEELNHKYNAAPVNVEAITLGDEFGKLKDGKYEMIFHKIEGLDSNEYLSENTQGIGAVFVNTNIAMPTTENFEPISAILSYEEAKTSAIAEINKDEIIAIMNAFNSSLDIGYINNSEENYTLSLVSDKYKGIYLNLIYFSNNGNNYLYDRSTKKCVDIGDLLTKYFVSEEASA